MMENVTNRILFYGGLWLIGSLTLISLHTLGVQDTSIAKLLVSLGFLMGISQAISIAQVKHWGDLSASDVNHPRTRKKLSDQFSRRRTSVLTRLVVSLVSCVLAGFASFGSDIGNIAGFWILAFGLGCIYLLVIASIFFVKDMYDYWDAKRILEDNAKREKAIADQIARLSKDDTDQAPTKLFAGEEVQAMKEVSAAKKRRLAKGSHSEENVSSEEERETRKD